MARMAVHAGMAGKTDVLIGYWHNELIHVPIRDDDRAHAAARHDQRPLDRGDAVHRPARVATSRMLTMKTLVDVANGLAVS